MTSWSAAMIFFLFKLSTDSLDFPPLILLSHRLLDVDEFVAKLWEVHLTVKAEGYVQVLVSRANEISGSCG